MKLIFIILSLVATTNVNAQLNESDSTNYYLKACGGGFGNDTLALKTIAIKNTGINKATVQYVISKMLQAHGGMAKWNAAPTLSFTHILVYGQPLETEFWVSNETTEIKTERTYHDWPVFNGRLASDGKKTWTENWQLGNPPGTNVNNIYHAMAMPWLTQKKNVLLEAEPLATLPGDSTAYFVVKLTYKQPSKESPHKYYKLFIHPQTFLLRGLEFNITYAPFLDLIGLPKEVKSLGPFTHIFYEYVKVEGLIFPGRYDSFDKEGNNSGRHIAYNYSLKKAFDLNRMKTTPASKIADEKSER
jgi:hypothetical protein